MITITNRPVLVLNKGWVAVDTVPLYKAMKKLSATYRDGTPKAKIVRPEDYQSFTWKEWKDFKPREDDEPFRSAHSEHRIPTIIVLTKYDKLRHNKNDFTRRGIFRRDDFTCQYCGCRPGSTELSIDHVVPRSNGGKTTWDNCVAACTKCNAKKANKSLESSGMKLLRMPHKPMLPMASRPTSLRMYKDWHAFFSDAYWNVQLENDISD